MKRFRVPLRVVFYREKNRWVAHCLEFDLCGDGANKADALRSLSGGIRLQLQESLTHDNLRNLFSPADPEVQEKFFAGKDTATGELTIDPNDSVVIEDTLFREYSDELAEGVIDLTPA